MLRKQFVSFPRFFFGNKIVNEVNSKFQNINIARYNWKLNLEFSIENTLRFTRCTSFAMNVLVRDQRDKNKQSE